MVIHMKRIVMLIDTIASVHMLYFVYSEFVNQNTENGWWFFPSVQIIFTSLFFFSTLSKDFRDDINVVDIPEGDITGGKSSEIPQETETSGVKTRASIEKTTKVA